jgi:hypothetical protein
MNCVVCVVMLGLQCAEWSLQISVIVVRIVYFIDMIST